MRQEYAARAVQNLPALGVVGAIASVCGLFGGEVESVGHFDNILPNLNHFVIPHYQPNGSVAE